jgi:hypothetical protein
VDHLQEFRQQERFRADGDAGDLAVVPEMVVRIDNVSRRIDRLFCCHKIPRVALTACNAYVYINMTWLCRKTSAID